MLDTLPYLVRECLIRNIDVSLALVGDREIRFKLPGFYDHGPALLSPLRDPSTMLLETAKGLRATITHFDELVALNYRILMSSSGNKQPDKNWGRTFAEFGYR